MQIQDNNFALDADQIVAHVVRQHSECAAVFQRHRIDFCCKGTISIAAAAHRRGLDPGLLLQELQSAIAGRQDGTATQPSTLETSRLIAHIVSTHHAYLRRTLPFIQKLASKVSRVHGEHNPRLRELETLVNNLAETLLAHIADEESNLFADLLRKDPAPADVRAELTAMREEHLEVSTLLDRVRETADNFQPPHWACTSYRTLLRELLHLDSDLHVHVHLENHVLLPRYLGVES